MYFIAFFFLKCTHSWPVRLCEQMVRSGSISTDGEGVWCDVTLRRRRNNTSKASNTICLTLDVTMVKITHYKIKLFSLLFTALVEMSYLDMSSFWTWALLANNHSWFAFFFWQSLKCNNNCFGSYTLKHWKAISSSCTALWQGAVSSATPSSSARLVQDVTFCFSREEMSSSPATIWVVHR